MSKTRLIKRLKWYYPAERFHTYVTFPLLLVFQLIDKPLNKIILLSYGLAVCIFILYQGQLYWKLKLKRLKGEQIDQEKNIQFFRKAKRLNWILISLMLPVLLYQLFLQKWDFKSNEMLFWGIIANLFAICEHVNYYFMQLMLDNKYDIQYVLKYKRLKKASLAKDLDENKI